MRKGYRLLILLLLLISIAFIVKPLKVFATNTETITISSNSIPDITMTYSCGYNFYGKYGRQFPIFANIKNGSTDFHGWLEVSIPLVENGKVYRKEILLKEGEETDVSMVIPLSGGFGQVEVKLVDNNGNIILENLNSIKLGNYEKILFAGVLSDSPYSLRYVDNLEIKSFLFNRETFPEELAYLDMFDILIINDFDTSLLNKNQIRVIKQWVQDGGSLVLGSGFKADKVIPALADEFAISIGNEFFDVPVTSHLDESYFEELKSRILRFEEERSILREQIVNRNKQLSSYNNPTINLEPISSDEWPSSYIDDYTNPNISKMLASVSFIEEENHTTQKIKKISTKLIDHDSGKLYAIYQKKELGKGNIILYTFDLSINGELEGANATFGAIITSSIVSNLSENKQIQISNEQDGSSIPYSITSSMSYTDTQNIPRVNPYLAILVVYILLIGPICYLILNKLDKHSLTWIVVPVMALVFTLVIFIVGSKTRVEEPFVGYVRISKFRDRQVEDELYFSLTAPYNDKYRVELSSPNKNINLIGDGHEFPQMNLHQVEIDPNKYTAAINYGREKTTLEINNNPAFSPVFFEVSNEYAGNSPVESDISYTGDRIEGTITNKSAYTLRNTVYIGDGLIINLGTIYSGQTVEVSHLDKFNIHDLTDIYNSEIVDQIARSSSSYGEYYAKQEIAGINNVGAMEQAEIGLLGDESLLDIKRDGTGDINRKKEILLYLIDKHITTFPDENCIVGFVDNMDTDSLIKQMADEFDIYGTNVILAEARVDYSKEGSVFVPSISSMIRNENANYFGMKGGYYTFSYYSADITEEETIMEYYLPKDDKIISINYYALSNQDPLSKYNAPFTGSIYAYNRRNGQFDHVLTVSTTNNKDTTLITSDKLRDYLTVDNVLTLRYEPNYIQTDSTMVLPKISYWKDGE